MKAIINEKDLQSTAYRRLFECAKTEGTEPLINLVREMIALENSDVINQSVLEGRNELLSLSRRHKDLISYIRSYSKDFNKYGFKLNSLKNLEILKEIQRDEKLLDKYLENARLLEELKVGLIDFVGGLEYQTIETIIFRDKTETITDIIKKYTNGNIVRVSPEHEEGIFSSKITYTIDSSNLESSDKLWLLTAENHADLRQFRYFNINSFGFDASALPNEEEISSYEIPSFLTLKK